MKRVEIHWRDSHRYTYQMPADEAVNTITIKSIGWLVSQDKHQVVISQDDIEGDIRGVMAIPKENIVKLTTI